jgi:hypothetical protein
MTVEVLALLLVNGCLLAAGAGVTRALGAWRRPKELVGILATSFLAGVAAFGVAAQLLYVLGFSLSAAQALVLCALLASTAALRIAPASPLVRPRPLTRLEWVAALLVACPLILLALDALHQPLASWDAWTQWTPKAQALVQLDGLDTAVFTNPAYADWHPDYPLLVPALEAFAFRFGVGVRVVHLEFWLLLAALAVSLIELLRPRVGPLLAWSAVVAIVWTPKFGAEALSANADMPLAVFLVLAAVAAWLWISEGSTAALGLVGVFGAAALATKLEGLIELAIVLGIALVLALRHSRRRGLLLAAAGGAAALVGIVPWRLWTILNDAPVTYAAGAIVDSAKALEPSRLPISALLLLRQLFDPDVWLVLVPLALCALAVAGLGPRRDRRALAVAVSAGLLLVVGVAAALAIPAYSYPWRPAYWLLFLPAFLAGGVFVGGIARGGGSAAYVAVSLSAMFAALVAIYVFTPYDFAWHLGTSSSRVVLPLGLFAAAFVPIVLSRSFADGSRGSGP